MVTTDIRHDVRGAIDKIVFADSNDWCYCAVSLRKSSDNQILLLEEDDGDCVGIYKPDVENLIKALQKAVELGWTK